MINNFKNQLEADVTGFRSRLQESLAVVDALNRVVQAHDISTTSQAGRTDDETVNGIAVLASAVDDVVDGLETSLPQQVSNQLTIAQLTSDTPEIGPTMRAAGNLDVVITSPVPGAVAAAAARVHERTPTAVRSSLSLPATMSAESVNAVAATAVDLTKPMGAAAEGQSQADGGEGTDGEVVEWLADSLKAVVGTTTDATNSIQSQENELRSQLSQISTDILKDLDIGFKSLLENVAENRFLTTTIAIKALVNKDVPPAVLRTIISHLDDKNVNAAARIVSEYSDLSPSQLSDRLIAIDPSISTLVRNPSSPIGIRANRLRSNENRWTEDTDDVSIFTNISSSEELDAELQNINREITEVVVHNTDTFLDQNLSAADIQLASRAVNGRLGMDFHYVITRDGNIERGRPIETPAASPFPNDHNLRSIHIVMVGGINMIQDARLSGHVETWETGSRAYTPAQWRAYHQFFRGVYKAYPGIQALAVSDIDLDATGPGFDVRAIAKSRYNKDSLFTNPATQPPFTRLELIRAQR